MRPALLDYIEEILITTFVEEDFMNRIRVMIVNSYSLLMDAVQSLLRANGQFEVVSTAASNLADFSRENKHLEPNIVIIDEAMTFINSTH
jgi:DNA-binding NarL/FixJ family response regulator